MDVQPVLCTIYKISADTGVPSSTPTVKGSSTINQVSISRNDSICTMPGEVVHQHCCCKYCNPHQIAKDTNQEEPMPSTLNNGRLVLFHLRRDFWSSLVIFRGIQVGPLLLFQIRDLLLSCNHQMIWR